MWDLHWIQVVVLAVTAVAASGLAAVVGFGGAIMLLPPLVWVFGVRDAVPILTIAQLVGNGTRVWFNRTEVGTMSLAAGTHSSFSAKRS